MTSIFLSHNSKDKPFVKQLAKQLNKEGIITWVDNAEIGIGDSLIEKISEGIQNMTFVGVILSPNSVNSKWVKKELDVSMNIEISGKSGKKIKVLPILYEECEIPLFLQGKKYVDFTELDKFPDSLDELISTIKGSKKNEIINSVKRNDNTEDKSYATISPSNIDNIKYVFNFASSIHGLNMTKDKAIDLAEKWAYEYNGSKINNIIQLFHFASSIQGLNKTKQEAWEYAIKKLKDRQTSKFSVTII